ncbi:MAG: hypothetical protein LQ340_001602 [Diploschistes diacapsis]|nr:MAG: hypothetical protein LQ340_001602 [Diploschistes diacapsis]
MGQIVEFLFSAPEPERNALVRFLQARRSATGHYRRSAESGIDAEQQVLQTVIDRWTIELIRRYNRGAYLKASWPKLEHQLALAVKLVRGAYIGNDQREKIHDAETGADDPFNGIVRDLLQGTSLGLPRGQVPVDRRRGLQ